MKAQARKTALEHRNKVLGMPLPEPSGEEERVYAPYTAAETVSYLEAIASACAARWTPTRRLPDRRGRRQFGGDSSDEGFPRPSRFLAYIRDALQDRDWEAEL